MKRALTVAALAVFVFFAVFSAPPASALEINRHLLPNGLLLLHVERHNLPLVITNLMIKASPLDEPKEKAGLASLTSGLLQEGTSKRSSRQISSEIEFIGASLGASTNEDYTSISLSVLKKDIDKGFEILADVLLNPVFPEGEIERKKTLVKGSLRRSEEDPSFIAGREFKKAVFGDKPYGRLVSGVPETIDAIGREDIVNFHSGFYVPGNAMLVVTGDITAEELKGLLDKYFGNWQGAAPALPGRAKLDAVTRDAGDKNKTVVLVDRNLTQANIVLGHAGISRDDPDYYAVLVMNYILGGGGFSSRLMYRIRDELGLAYDVHSYFSAHKYGGFFQAGVQTKNPSAKTAIEEILGAIEKIRAEPVEKRELEDAKAYLTGSFPRRVETMRKITDFLGAVEFYGLGMDYIEKYPGYINGVSAEDVQRVAQKYLHPDRYVLVVVAKQSEAKIKSE